MIPKSGKAGEGIKVIEEASRTYRIDYDKDRILGNVDGRDAIEQYVYKTLSTERYRHLIYTFNYGVEFEDLFGKSKGYVAAVIEERIRAALQVDDRVLEIRDFFVSGQGKSVFVRFKVVSTLGEVNIKKEVTF